jgi:DNA replication and repair protein RecF
VAGVHAPAPQSPLVLTQFTARSFRNLQQLHLEPAPGSHLLLGGNGAGKTSVLEAIYVLATTRSFRAAQILDCVTHGATELALAGEVETDRRSSLAVGVVGEVRQRSVNGKPTSLAEHLAVLPVVAWSAAEMGVLVGPPAARRRFMDRGVVATRPPALEVLGRYREALRQKRELLCQGAAGIEIWNELLAATAAEVIRLRALYVDALRGELAAVLAEGGFAAAGLHLPEIGLRYQPSPPQGLEGAAAIAAALEQAADRELRRQQPLVGPQRDELEILWGGHELRRVASAGERKALSLLMLAAHGRVVEGAGRRPVYLLDDADAELAPAAVAAVWAVYAQRVEATAGQLFASSNRPQVWLTLDVGSLWEMERGAMARL